MVPFDPREPVSTWTHALGLAAALPAAAYLWVRTRGQGPKRACMLVYGLGLVACYAASSLAHGVRGPAGRVAALDRLDRATIYLFIAACYTPVAGVLLRGRLRRALLTVVWAVAGSAAAVVASGVALPSAVSTGLYLGLGWGVVVCLFELARVVPRRSLRPLVGGGLAYSVGAVLNFLRWPALWPGVFGPHELFHLFVLAGSAAHYRFALDTIVPFRAPQADAGPGGR